MKIFKGKVISKNMEKTATVLVERVVVHSLYKKRFKKTKKYQIHDEFNSEIGQWVKFVATKPYSKLKKWKVIEVINEEGKGKGDTKRKEKSKRTKK